MIEPTPVHVLIVEDSLTDTLLLRDALARDAWSQYRVETVTCIRDALQRLEQDLFDIILLDPGLPDSQGLNTFLMLNQRWPNLPVILLSGLADESSAIEAVHAGAQDYLVKGPIAWEMIGRAIRYAIQRQQTRSVLQTSEARFRTLIKQSTDAIALIDRDGFIHAEGQISKIRVPSENINDLAVLVHPDDLVNLTEKLVPLINRAQQMATVQFRAKGEDDLWHWLELTATDLLDEPGIEAIVVNYRDITERKVAEDELRLARFSIDHLSDAIYWIDQDGRIVDINQRVVEMLGYSREEILHSPLTLFDHQMNPDQWKSDWNRLLKYQVTSSERQHVTRDGQIIPVEITACLLDYGGRSLDCAFVRDITTRKQAAEAIERSERKYRSLFENSSVGMFRMRFSDGYIIEMNSKACEILGYQRDEINSGRVTSLWDDQSSIYQLGRMLQSGQPLDGVEVTINTHTGKKTCLISAMRVADEDVIEGTLQNITERKQSESDLQERTKELALLLEAGRELGSTLELKEIYKILHQFIARTVPCDMLVVSSYNPAEDLIRCEYLMDVSGEIDPSEFPPIPLEPPGQGTQSLVIRSGKSLLLPDYEKQRRTAQMRFYFNGQGNVVEDIEEDAPRTRSAILVPLFVQNRVVGVLQVFSYVLNAHTEDHLRYIETLVFRVSAAMSNAVLFKRLQNELIERRSAEDEVRRMNTELEQRVSERTADLSRANAELERTARAKDEFLANMSHELRTPLNAILTLTESLEEGIYEPVNPRQLVPLRTISESGHHLLNLINDVLDLSKIAAGKLELMREWIELEPVCQASLRMVRQMALKKNQKVSLEIDPTATYVYADQRYLKQMLVNLLSNAVKFTPNNGSIGLEIQADAEQGQIHLTVWDTGIGIAPENTKRLFLPFVQLDAGLTRQFGGTGLGLPLVYRMAELHEGSIALSSSLGKGSRFTLSLPWSQQHDRAIAAQDADAVLTGIKTAMIVDESSTFTDQITRYLNELGIKCQVISGGELALQQMRKTPPDVLLLDIILPDISGWEVLRRLKAQPETAAIPVIITSVIDEPAQAAGLGAADSLLKPLTRPRLIEALKKAVPAHANPAGSDAQKYRILLAEDHTPNQITYTDFLSNFGYQIMLASNGAEAVMLARETPPDLILMDIQMPGMDGLEATRRIRTEPRLKDIPIIALTALAMPDDRERCLAAGANEYLAKPVSLKHLVHIIESLIKS